MSDHSGIEWTDATWNPVTGCTKVSPGCDHCYAETFAERFRGVPGHHFEQGFDITLRPERLDIPLRWTKPRRIFVNSMSDLFHDSVPDEFIAQVFAVMALAPQHTFQVLTKRHARMRSLLSNEDFEREVAERWMRHDRRPTYTPWPGWPIPNVWLGVSVDDQQWADIRVPALLDAPAAVRFLSCEPLLDLVRLAPEWLHSDLCAMQSGGPMCACIEGDELIDWVIVGGESGHGARPMYLDWARSLRDQCVEASIPFLFKQWGEWKPAGSLSIGELSDPRELHGERVDDGKPWRRLYRRVGKKAAGRELDGRTWDEYPAANQ